MSTATPGASRDPELRDEARRPGARTERTDPPSALAQFLGALRFLDGVLRRDSRSA